ncbi:hypothetical protein [uncultured Clostridium sp.]|uniref:hypothetical protein n=1 Tax=uncultured Clostridium sp. TaxID=59620 RepID=UPI002584D0B5|nr:hypothetical protein [uncultured Clostridium sp.]
MKKKGILFTIILAVIIVIIISFFNINQKRLSEKLLKDISVDDIESVTVILLPPNVSYELNYEEIEELVEILHSVEIYNKDNSYNEYYGQNVTFTIVKDNNTTIKIMAYNPFLVIDGTGYKTKYEPCERLSSFGNKIGNLNK